MKLRISKAIVKGLQDIGPVTTGDCDDLPCHPTLYKMWESGDLRKIQRGEFELAYREWVYALADMIAWDSAPVPSLNRLLDQGDLRFRRQCLTVAGKRDGLDSDFDADGYPLEG